MPLQKQVVPIQLGQGIDTKSDPKQVVMGKLLTLENALFDETGAFIKRNGFKYLAPTSNLVTGNAISSYNNELLAISDTAVYSYDQSQDLFNSKGTKIASNIEVSSIIRNVNSQTKPDSAYANGKTIYVWTEQRGGVVLGSKYCVIDQETGGIIIQETSIGPGICKAPKVRVLGNYFVILYASGGGNEAMTYMTVDTTNPTTVTAPVIVETPAAAATMDAVVINNRLFVIYSNGLLNAAIFYLTSSLVQSPITDLGIANPQGFGTWGDASNNFWFGIITAPAGELLNYYVYDFNLAAQITTGLVDSLATIENVSGVVVGTTATIYYSTNANLYTTFGTSVITQNTATLGGVVGTPSTLIRGVGAYSKVFTYNGTNYIVGLHFTNNQPTYFLIDGNGNVVSKLAPGTAGKAFVYIPHPEVNQIAPGVFEMSFLQVDLLSTTTGGVIYTQSGVSSVLFTFGEGAMTEVAGDNLHISGGMLGMYDGANAVEHGFSYYPENFSAAQSAIGGSISAGTYQYNVVYEWMDNQGQTHRSSTGIPISVIVAAGTTNRVFITIPTLRLTQKSNVSLVVYRTQANQTIFYRVSSVSAPLLNDKTVDSLVFTDTLADASLPGNPQIYTTGGIVDNIQVPATNIITAYKNRLFAVLEEDPLTFWYSQQVNTGVPVEFSDQFFIRIEERGGGITAMDVMDDKLILFKETSVYYMVGDGPSPNGSNNNFSVPQLVTSDTGCNNKKSVVPTPIGIMFQSPKGIYLLERSLATSYIGADVEAYNNQVVTSAVLIPSKRQVRLTMDSGVILCYDYFVRQWSVFTNNNGVDGTLFQDLYHYIKTDGKVEQETPSLYQDADGSTVLMSLTTSWLKLAGIQGFQRVYDLLLLADWYSAHNLQVKIAYDFSSNFSQTTTLPALIQPTGTIVQSTSIEQFRLFLNIQKCEAIQFQINELQPTFSGQGLTLSSLVLEVGAKKGAYKLPSARSYG